MKVVITNAASDLAVVVNRSLQRAGHTVAGCVNNALPRWLAPRRLSAVAAIKAGDRRQWQDSVLAFLARTEADLYLPLCTRGVRLAAERRAELPARCRVLAPDTEAFFTAFRKDRCMTTCTELGIPCAGSLTAAEARELLSRGEGRRIVVKPAFDIGSAQGLQLVGRAEDLEQAIVTCSAAHGPCLIQSFIPGGAEAMRSLTVLLDGEGRLVGSFLLQKLRQVPISGGNTALARSCREGDLLEVVMPFFRHGRWRGAAEVEFKWDAREGLFKLIEVNPRFGGNLRLAAVCGVDLPLRLLQAAAGLELPEQQGLEPFPEGIPYLAPTLFTRSVAADAAQRGWRLAMAAAGSDAIGAGAVLRSLLAEPLPILGRILVPPQPTFPLRG